MTDETKLNDLAAALKLGLSIAPMSDAPAKAPDLFEQLLGGVADDDRAVEKTGDSAQTLEAEFAVIAALRSRKKRLEEELERVQGQLSDANQRMADAMALQGTRQFAGVEGQGSCHLATEYRVKVVDPAAFTAWADEHAPELYAINAKTRDGFIRRQYRDRGIAPDSPDFPPGLEVKEVDVLRVRGARGPADSTED